MDRPRVYVIVLNWNLRDDTIACVESLLEGSYPNQRVVIVDNGSEDGSSLAFASHFGEAVDLLLNKENLGFAKGVNVGVRHALAQGAEYVLLLNNDTVVDAGLIEHFVQASQLDSTLGVLGAAIYYYDEPDRFWRLGAVHRRWIPFPKEVGRDTVDRGQFWDLFEVDYVTGCAMWVPARLFDTIGLLDERYVMYYEDADFCRRVRNAGYRVAVVPEARVWHKVSTSARHQAAISQYQRTRYRVRFYRQHSQGPQYWLALILLGGQELLRLGAALMRGRFDLVDSGWRGLRHGCVEKLEQNHEAH